MFRTVLYILAACSTLFFACASVQAADAGVQCVQSELIELDYDPGVVDGLFGDKTADALAAYVADEPGDIDLPSFTEETASQWCLELRVRHCSYPQLDPHAIHANEQSPFIGVWYGAWGQNGEIEHTLIVTGIDEDGSAVGYYINDAYPQWYVRPGCNRISAAPNTAAIDERGLSITFGGYATAVYALDGDTLAGTYRSVDSGGDVPGTLTRIQ